MPGAAMMRSGLAAILTRGVVCSDASGCNRWRPPGGASTSPSDDDDDDDDDDDGRPNWKMRRPHRSDTPPPPLPPPATSSTSLPSASLVGHDGESDSGDSKWLASVRSVRDRLGINLIKQKIK